MLESIREIIAILLKKERLQAYWLLVALTATALIEVAGIASILPFMATVSNPQIIQTNAVLSWLYGGLNFDSVNLFLFFLGAVVLGALVFSNAFSALTLWMLLRFIYLLGHSLAERLLNKYLYQPYVFFLCRNTSDLAKNLLEEVQRFTGGVLLPIMHLFAKLFVALCVLVLLLIVDPLLAAMVTLALGGAYAAIFALVRRNLTRIGGESLEVRLMRFRAANEAFGGIKDLKLLGREGVFVKRYSELSRLSAIHDSTIQVVSQIPKYALETIAFGGILLIVLYLIAVKQNVGQAVPLIALYAFAGYRLMPALQQVFVNAAAIRYHAPSLHVLYQDFSSLHPSSASAPPSPELEDLVDSCRQIELRNLTFSYPNSPSPALRDINLVIDSNTTVGFVGSTGSGKTTIIDIILGLLVPSSGHLIVDGTIIGRNIVRAWQKQLGYVPQQFYLSDDTIARNIAFGIPYEEIDLRAVEHAARIANIHDFIRELPQGYQTIMGERGIRLSGGQRQRIAIARAVYHDPKVLILDEATSALDGITENAIIDAIHNLSHKKTIIIVAHRLSTVKNCDRIYIIESGQIVEDGVYSELAISSSHFRKMARIG